MSRKAVAAAALIAGALMWLVVSWPDSEQDSPSETRSEPLPSGSAAPPMAATDVDPPAPAQPTPTPTSAPRHADEVPPVYAQPQEPARPNGLQLDRDLGPVEDYRRQYEAETRDNAAHEVETHIRSAFEHSRTPDLFQSASCHESICKVLMRWSSARSRDYIGSVAWLGVGGHKLRGKPDFDGQLAVSPVSPQEADGTRLVELYLKRRSPMAANERDPHR